MKYTHSYFSICIKKSLKKYTAILLTTVFLVMALFFVAIMILDIDSSDESRQRIKIGLVGNLDDIYMGISLATIEEIDDLGMSVKFVEMDEDEAKEALIDSQISAYVSVPPNFITDLSNCKDVKATFVIPKSAAASGILMREIVKVVSPLVSEAESGIFALQVYNRNEGINSWKNVEDLNMHYIDMVLSRADAFKLESIGIQSLRLMDYYIYGILTFFLLLFALAACSIFSDKNLPLGRLFCSKNVKPIQLVGCEYTSYLIIMWLTIFIIAVVAVLLSLILGLNALEPINMLIVATPCILMIAAMHFFIYEATSGIVTGVLAQFIVAIFTGYISGCFYPYYFFPEIVQKIAAILPSGIMFECLRNYASGDPCWSNIVASLAYTALFLTASSGIRKYRLRRDTI